MRYDEIVSTAARAHFILDCKAAIVGFHEEMSWEMRPAAAQSDSYGHAYFEPSRCLLARGRPLLWLAGGAEESIGLGGLGGWGRRKWRASLTASAACTCSGDAQQLINLRAHESAPAANARDEDTWRGSTRIARQVD